MSEETQRASAHGVAWLEGMFLRPQHLQQQSLYFESLLTQQLRSANPFFWGVRTLELDEDALAARRIQVKTFEAVLPDGTLVRTGDNVTVEARSFEAAAVPLDVWIGLRRPRAGESASALPDEARRDVRYRLHSQSVEDHNRPDSKTGIDFLVPNLRLYLSGEQLEVEQCEAIRVARIVPSSDKKKIFEAAPNYAPPLLVLQASAALTNGHGRGAEPPRGPHPRRLGPDGDDLDRGPAQAVDALHARARDAAAAPDARVEGHAAVRALPVPGRAGGRARRVPALRARAVPEVRPRGSVPVLRVPVRADQDRLEGRAARPLQGDPAPVRAQRVPDQGLLERALGPAQPGLSRHQVAALARRAARTREAVRRRSPPRTGSRSSSATSSPGSPSIRCRVRRRTSPRSPASSSGASSCAERTTRSTTGDCATAAASR